MAPHDRDPRPEADDADVLQLDDALKLAGVAATGGQAKQLIQQGEVRVNGEVETRRKRKLVEGDVVEVGGESFEIALSDDDEDGDEDGDEDAPAAAADASAVEDDEEVLRLPPGELDRWAEWVIDRVREDDGEAVILRLGGLHPDALEALFERLPADVEDAVLDALDAVLEADDEARPPRDGPLEA